MSSVETITGRPDSVRWYQLVMEGKTMIEVELDMLQEDVEIHVNGNTVEADFTRSICVDGRHSIGQNRGALARPGGDLGLTLALLKLKQNKILDVTAEKALNLTLEFVKSQERKLGWHSDTHVEDNDHSESICGCGHFAKQVKFANDYGVDQSDVLLLNEKIRAHQKEHSEDMDFVILKGDHAEQAVLLIKSDYATVNSYDQSTDAQFFIYDRVRDQKLSSDFVVFLNQKGITVLFDEFMSAIDYQNATTLSLLAADKPIFAVEASLQGTAKVVLAQDRIISIEELREQRRQSSQQAA